MNYLLFIIYYILFIIYYLLFITIYYYLLLFIIIIIFICYAKKSFGTNLPVTKLDPFPELPDNH